MLTNLENMEIDELQKMGTGSNVSKREGDQPEELAAKESRDNAMDQEPQGTKLTKARMDEMLMDQVMAVSCGTPRVCVNEKKYEPATIRGLPTDLVKKGQTREMKDVDDMIVLEWVRDPTGTKRCQDSWLRVDKENEISIRSASGRRFERLRID